jgi:hypothetical protein
MTRQGTKGTVGGYCVLSPTIRNRASTRASRVWLGPGLDLERLRLEDLWNVRTTICMHHWRRGCNVQAVSAFGICRYSTSGDGPSRAAITYRCGSQAAQSRHVGSDLNTL